MTETIDFNPFGAVGVGERHEVYDSLARTGPIHRVVLPTGAPAWVVTGYTHVRAALNDPRLVKGRTPGLLLLEKARPDLFSAIGAHMLTCDGAEHARLRGLVGAAFTRRRIDALTPRIQRITHDLLEDLDTSAPADLIAGFAHPLPMTVICELIGVPEQDRDEMRRTYPAISQGPPFVKEVIMPAGAGTLAG